MTTTMLRGAVLDNQHVGDIRGALGTIRLDDTSPGAAVRLTSRLCWPSSGPGLIVMIGDKRRRRVTGQRTRRGHARDCHRPYCDTNRHIMVVDSFGQRVQMSVGQFRKLAAKGSPTGSRRWRASEAGRSPIL